MKKFEVGVASIGIMFVPGFMKIRKLVQKLIRTNPHINSIVISCLLCFLKEKQAKTM
jgi:uncharacterized protein YneF (UPF0154 family)